ncbi:hypothetical protein HDU67_010030 [Dinochytrium kinnereticum]|nr:hypothetical protein HDU67_010030 [Dinochytrium kinnereticum]
MQSQSPFGGPPIYGGSQQPPQANTQPSLPPFGAGAPPPSSGYGTYTPPMPGTPPQGQPYSNTSFPPPPSNLGGTPVLSNNNSPYASPQMAARPPVGTGGMNYQGSVRGIHGWNDPPNLIGVASKKAAAAQPAAAPTPTMSDVDAGMIGSAMVTAMTVIKQAAAADPSQRRIVDDTDKRLEELLERLGTQSIPNPVMIQLSKVAAAVNSRDIPGASAASVQLTLLSTAHSSEARWILGVKRLIELYARFGGN